jgi:hypothetical protein
MTMMGEDIASAFARRLRANADHADKQKFSVANLSTMSLADCRALADWIEEAVELLAARTMQEAMAVGDTFQARVQPWMMACFGPTISADKLERGDRLLEEVLELLQSVDYPRERIASLSSYVWSRPKGEPTQEVGGSMVTLAAFCLAHGLDMHAAGETELARIWTKVEAIRAKQAAKPTGSALPVAVEPTPAPAANVAGLVGKLRKLADWADQSQHEKWCRKKDIPVFGFAAEGAFIREAADATEALQAERDSLANWRCEASDTIVTLTARATAAEAEAATLRAAQWREDEPQKDGVPFLGMGVWSMRWTPYSKNSDQYRRGQHGRWQRAREHGGWENCDLPRAWKPDPQYAGGDPGRPPLPGLQQPGGER